jgi:hypothetical protein
MELWKPRPMKKFDDKYIEYDSAIILMMIFQFANCNKLPEGKTGMNQRYRFDLG